MRSFHHHIQPLCMLPSVEQSTLWKQYTWWHGGMMVLGVYSSWGGIPLAIKTHFGVWTVFSLFESWNDNSGQFGLAIRFQTAVVMPTSLPQGSFLSAIFSMWLMPLVPWGFPLPGSLSFLHSLFLVWPSFLPSLLLFHWCSTIYIFCYVIIIIILLSCSSRRRRWETRTQATCVLLIKDKYIVRTMHITIQVISLPYFPLNFMHQVHHNHYEQPFI